MCFNSAQVELTSPAIPADTSTEQKPGSSERPEPQNGEEGGSTPCLKLYLHSLNIWRTALKSESSASESN